MNEAASAADPAEAVDPAEGLGATGLNGPYRR